MDVVHAHLQVNHLPIFGVVLALPLLVLALLQRDQRAYLTSSFILLLAATLGAAFSMVTGKGAEHEVDTLPAVSVPDLDEHEDRAKRASPATALACVGAGVAWWLTRKRGRVHAPSAAVVLAVTLVAAGLMVWTGQAGGRIRHSEIRQ